VALDASRARAVVGLGRVGAVRVGAEVDDQFDPVALDLHRVLALVTAAAHGLAAHAVHGAVAVVVDTVARFGLAGVDVLVVVLAVVAVVLAGVCRDLGLRAERTLCDLHGGVAVEIAVVVAPLVLVRVAVVVDAVANFRGAEVGRLDVVVAVVASHLRTVGRELGLAALRILRDLHRGTAVEIAVDVAPFVGVAVAVVVDVVADLVARCLGDRVANRRQAVGRTGRGLARDLARTLAALAILAELEVLVRRAAAVVVRGVAQLLRTGVDGLVRVAAVVAVDLRAVARDLGLRAQRALRDLHALVAVEVAVVVALFVGLAVAVVVDVVAPLDDRGAGLALGLRAVGRADHGRVLALVGIDRAVARGQEVSEVLVSHAVAVVVRAVAELLDVALGLGRALFAAPVGLAHDLAVHALVAVGPVARLAEVRVRLVRLAVAVVVHAVARLIRLRRLVDYAVALQLAGAVRHQLPVALALALRDGAGLRAVDAGAVGLGLGRRDALVDRVGVVVVAVVVVAADLAVARELVAGLQRVRAHVVIDPHVAHAVVADVELARIGHVDQAAVRIRRRVDVLLPAALAVEHQALVNLLEHGHGTAVRGLAGLLRRAGGHQCEREKRNDRENTPHGRLQMHASNRTRQRYAWFSATRYCVVTDQSPHAFPIFLNWMRVLRFVFF